jgi:enterochelin esterase-like enzyme
VALPSGLLGALPWRRRVAAMAGALLGFTSSVAVPFAQQALHPMRDAAGNPVTTSAGQIAHGVIVLYCLGALAAALGAGLGHELGDWLATPLVRLGSAGVAAVRDWRRRAGGTANERRGVHHLTGGWRRPLAQVCLVAAALALGLTSLGGVNDLLFYGPQALMQAPALTPAAAAAASGAPQVGQVLTIAYASAAFHGAQRTFFVYLPPGYFSPSAAHQGYPVVYLLHGSPGQADVLFQILVTPQVLDTLITSHQIGPVIVVAPDGNSTAPYTSQWLNGADGRERVEDAFVHEVVPYVDSHYRTIATPANRVVGGLSMGGFGAANLAVKHPDVFGGVIAMGAYFVPEGGAVWGHPELIAANSPGVVLQQSPAARHVRFYLAAATDDVPYVDDTRIFARELDALGVDHALDMWTGGHAWTVWGHQAVAGITWFFGPRHGRPVCKACDS